MTGYELIELLSGLHQIGVKDKLYIKMVYGIDKEIITHYEVSSKEYDINIDYLVNPRNRFYLVDGE
jgi:hypothetical protein